jgi:ribonucrease Y
VGQTQSHMLLALIAGAVVAAVTTAVGASLARQAALREANELRGRARAQAQALISSARSEVAAVARSNNAQLVSASLDERARAVADIANASSELDQRESAISAAQAEVLAISDAADGKQRALDEITKEAQSLRDRASGLERDTDTRIASVASVLEQRASVSARSLIDTMTGRWFDDARSRAAATVRAIEQTSADPAYDRQAKRLMELVGPRYQHHYLTERNVATLRCGADIVSVFVDQDAALHRAMEQVSGLALHINDEKDAIRMEGIDGVGREMIRRAVSRLERKPQTADDARRNPQEWASKAKDAVMQDIRQLGKRAFATLEVAKAHPEITELVGALNFRTSYTQNQWWHAMEAAYLAGMIAAEMGLDEKLARRATLMHDIGKALTHKIDGSHAVIGADIARRLGEPELVANAIGSHHNDEPQNSVYAYLVAGCDAMSGARPGARREMAEGFSAKVEDLERIGYERRGVTDAHAVHGGRELRVYVREQDVDDETVVEMSGDIASQISQEMTFPGQIKVTVIRAFEAVATAN